MINYGALFAAASLVVVGVLSEAQKPPTMQGLPPDVDT